MKRWILVIATLVSMFSLTGCGYNDFQRLDEKTKASWSEVLNQYQRRSDLIPNIVAAVKGEASFEQDTLTKVIEARSKATAIQATPDLINNPEAFNKFQQAQGELSSAQAGELRGGLLDPVLAEHGLAGGQCRDHRLLRMGLGDGDERHRLRGAVGADAGLGDPGVDGGQVGGDVGGGGHGMGRLEQMPIRWNHLIG